jgi:hypothetical protein
MVAVYLPPQTVDRDAFCLKTSTKSSRINNRRHIVWRRPRLCVNTTATIGQIIYASQ